MAHWNLATNRASLPHIPRLGPYVAATIPLAAAAILALVIASFVPPPLILPLLSIGLIGNAGLVALFAWVAGAENKGNRITAWDVAGASAFIGIAAGMLSDPEHVVRLFGLATAG